MRVTTWTLEMLAPPAGGAAEVPEGFRIERTGVVPPEYARFLYALIGGPWRWTDRLAWSREQWAEELDLPGSEFLIAYADAVPVGYLQLHAVPAGALPGALPGGATPAAGCDVEVRYFGIVESAMGRGLGRALLLYGVDNAWSLAERHPLPRTTRVWVHTCSLDGPGALENYRRRGFAVIDEVVTEEDYLAEPLGAWRSTTGL